jgi:(S)-mandelate dehydrogenase
MSDDSLNAYNISDLREQAMSRVPKGLFEFCDRGTEDEVSLRNNREVFDRIRFKPRTMVDVSRRVLETTIFGKKQSMPLVIAPTGLAGLLWYDGEIELAKAARAAGVPFTLSTGSMTALERVADEAGGDLWFQLYFWPDRSLSQKLVERAKAAGYKALMVTVDGVHAGNREYNIRNGFTIPFTFTAGNVTDVLMHPRWMLGVLARYMLTTGMPRYMNYPTDVQARITAGPVGRSSLRSDSVSWDDLKAMRKIWPHKLIVKGMLHPADAAKAVDYGADAIAVGNHGGRNLDGIISPMEVLPEIVDAVGKRTTILVDGGFRRGSDIVKALALGAHAVQIGRPTLYGVGAHGGAGAKRALDLFREEISRVMALLGVTSIEQLGPEYLLFADDRLRPPSQARANLKVVDGAKAAGEN